MSKRFLSVREFSSETGISVAMTYKNIESGRLKAIRQNGPLSNLLINADELEQWPKRKPVARPINRAEIGSSNV